MANTVPMAGPKTNEKGDEERTDDDSLLERIKAWYKEDSDKSFDWRKEAREDFAFCAGDQWNQSDKAQLEDQNRPVITFNRIGPIVDAVAGAEITNRQEVQYIPRELGDVEVNEAFTGAANWVRDECDAEDEESDAFQSTIICGMGWTETRVDFESNPDGDIVIESLDSLEMYWDAGSRKANLADSQRRMRVKDIAIEDARAMWPGRSDHDLNAKWADSYGERAKDHNASEAAFYKNDQDGRSGDRLGKVRVVQVQWWEKTPYWRVVDPETKQEARFPEAEYNKLTERAGAMGVEIKSVRQVGKKYFQAFVGAVVLKKGPAPCDDDFSLKCITGKRDRNKSAWYGLVRPMKDPQRWANKWLSQVLHIINSNAKGGLLAEKDAFENPRKAEDDWADPNAIIWTNPGAITNGKIQVRDSITWPTGLDKLMEFAITSIRDVTGVNLELMGMREANQAGVLEYQRRQSGMTMLATLFNSLRRYRKEQGRVMLYFIQEYISDERLVRVLGDGKAQYVKLMKEEGVGNYDVVVDDAASSPNQKEKTWSILQQVLPMLAEADLSPEFWTEVVRTSPLPSSLTEKFREAVEKGSGIPDEVKEQMQKLQAENAQLKDKKEETAKELGIKEFEANADVSTTRRKVEGMLEIERFKVEETLALKEQEVNATIALKRKHEREHGEKTN